MSGFVTKPDRAISANGLGEEPVLDLFNVSKDQFYYVADSALFTEKNIKKANKKNVRFITRAPGTTKLTGELIEETWESENSFSPVTLQNAHNKDVEYSIQEKFGKYKDVDCKFTVCYLKSLETQKEKTIIGRTAREQELIKKLQKTYLKREFACQADAEKEIVALQSSKEVKKVNFHDLTYDIIYEEKKKPGRPKKNQAESDKKFIYKVTIGSAENKTRQKDQLKRDSTFVLVSNHLTITGENMLKEYKNQSSVEKKFQQLKSPHFVNALYLDTPERIEALTYLILIAMMSLSVVERVVRREMKQNEDTVIGPGKVMMTQPTLQAIVIIFHNASINKITYKGSTTRKLLKPLNDSQKKVLHYLGLTESIFTKASFQPT